MSPSTEVHALTSFEKLTDEKHELALPQLATYTDYRQYLRDYYKYKRALHQKDHRAYSYAMFAAAADIKSPNYLKLIIEGQRNLSEAMILRFAKAMQLNKEDTTEFKALVLYNQELEPVRRNQYLKNLSDLRVQRQLHGGDIDARTWDKVPNWIAWVLQSMIDQDGVDFDPRRLQNLLSSKVTLGDIEAALNKLLQSGEIARDENTREMRKTRQLIESPESVPVALIRKIQAELMYLGLESLFRDDPAEREFGALTVALTDDEFEQIRFELRQLRKRLHRDVAAKREAGKGERVYQLNIQFFPMTRKVKKDV
jgi:uncharacterized protein (TIGR02147 family)